MSNIKNELISNVKEWVRLDNEMNTLKKELNIRKNEKKLVSTSLMNIMKNNNYNFDTQKKIWILE